VRAKYILAAFACVFLLAGFSALASASRRRQARTWLIVGAIFAGVSLWLFSRA
jgi:NO-binding membrane sensor protein with MHYT domain